MPVVISPAPSSLPPSGAASGDLTGTYPGPTIATTKVVKSIAKAGSTALKDAVTLTGGTNVTLTQSAQDISIAAAGGSQAVTMATKTLNNAEIKALAHPTPVTILAAPGAGFAIIPIHATVRLTWVADYTGIDPGAVVKIQLGTGTILGQLDELTGFQVTSLLANGEDSSAFMPAVGTASTSILSGISGYIDGDIENKAVSITADNATLATDFTGGNAGNSLKVTLLYYTVTF